MGVFENYNQQQEQGSDYLNMGNYRNLGPGFNQNQGNFTSDGFGGFDSNQPINLDFMNQNNGGFQLPTQQGAGGGSIFGNIGSTVGQGMDWLKNMDSNTLKNIGAGLSGASGLWDAWNQMGQLDAQEERFDFERNAFNRNIGNQASVINRQMNDQYAARMSALSPEQQKNYDTLDQYKKRNNVDGSPVKG